MKKILLFAVVSIVIASVSISSISAQSQYEIPSWVKGIAGFWAEGNISDEEFGEGISFLIENQVIKVPLVQKLIDENAQLKQEIAELNLLLEAETVDMDSFGTDSYSGCTTNKPYRWSDGFCYSVSEYLDNGCTRDYPYAWSDGYCYNVPEPVYEEPEYYDNGCPIGYPYIWSDGLCYSFPEPVYEETVPSCDPSYPDVCIPPYPPDLDCDEIYYSNFRVVGSDPHGFDTDYDGIGCEVGSPDSSNTVDTAPSCDPSYPDVCIPPYPPDLDCGEIGYSNFRVVGSDPHGFDRDGNGIGCES